MRGRMDEAKKSEPAVVASLEVAEVCKLLLQKGETLRNRELIIDLLDMSFQEIAF